TTIQANRILAEQSPYPLHLGVTEAGTPRMGILKSAVGIGSLLCDGIGNTIRVSLTAPVEDEVAAAKALLEVCGLKQGIEVVS
ncbi:MAG TPA: 4-hydroxy-3-methylbut-2-en-1-yl diphosphate synthase, partial [Clostridiales bacterium]|nr:4-hydroxy-3-methylbut-2-en-1-yl diphosphate synthase [Clostridiales bacterium]